MKRVKLLLCHLDISHLWITLSITLQRSYYNCYYNFQRWKINRDSIGLCFVNWCRFRLQLNSLCSKLIWQNISDSVFHVEFSDIFIDLKGHFLRLRNSFTNEDIYLYLSDSKKLFMTPKFLLRCMTLLWLIFLLFSLSNIYFRNVIFFAALQLIVQLCQKLCQLWVGDLTFATNFDLRTQIINLALTRNW